MTLTVRELLELRGSSLRLRQVTSDERPLERTIDQAEISSPGLALSGYTERFTRGRVQVLGETEVSYLESLGAEARRDDSDDPHYEEGYGIAVHSDRAQMTICPATPATPSRGHDKVLIEDRPLCCYRWFST